MNPPIHRQHPFTTAKHNHNTTVPYLMLPLASYSASIIAGYAQDDE